jgi:subtilisin family serine protease
MLIRRTLITALSCFLGVLSLAAQRPEFAANRYFVAFKEPIAPADTAFLSAQAVQIARTFGEIRTVEIDARSAAQVAAIERNPRVEFVEKVPMRYADSLGSAQLTPSLENGLYGLITTKAVDVHSLGFTGAAVKVGVADTAIDCSHVDLAANLVESVDMVGDRTHGGCWKPGDFEEEHASHVAGTIVGVFNTAGVYGVAYSASLYHARVLGTGGTGTSADVMDGVDYLVNTAGVRIVNLSLGGDEPSLAEARFYSAIRRHGALVVAASGNDGLNRISYPAAYESSIAVGAVDANNVIADFSNTGRNLDVVSPGVNVLSSVPAGTGSEASAAAASASFPAIGMEFAGKTGSSGVTGTLVSCGLAVAATDCPPSVFGNVALIQRGTNTFAEKVANAMSAGAAAVILYNNAPGLFAGTLGTETNNGQPWIPSITVSDTSGAALAAQAGSPATVYNVVSDWDIFSGTSMATPHVAGTLALMWSAAPSLSNDEIENNLFTTCTDLGRAGYDFTYGNGLVNALAAVQQSLTPALARR